MARHTAVGVSPGSVTRSLGFQCLIRRRAFREATAALVGRQAPADGPRATQSLIQAAGLRARSLVSRSRVILKRVAPGDAKSAGPDGHLVGVPRLGARGGGRTLDAGRVIETRQTTIGPRVATGWALARC
jgi:hypothetical protein